MNSVIFNYQAANAARQYNIVSNNNRKTTEKLSSGYKINRAADDAAGLSISEKMRWNIRGLDKASNNCEDGASLLQVADGALEEVSAMLHRVTELSIQAANDTNTPADRQAIQDEIAQVRGEINRIGNDTEFNTKPLFRGGQEKLGISGYSSISDITVRDLVLANTELGLSPIQANGKHSNMNLSAVALDDNGKKVANFSLIFGSGSTSQSKIKLSDDTTEKSFDLNQINSSNFKKAENEDTITWSRDFKLQDGTINATLTQTISIDKNSPVADKEKFYSMSYSLTNDGSDGQLDAKFMFHSDSAYNSNDSCEGYYIDGTKVTTNRIYAKDPTELPFSYPEAVKEGLPSSFSIINDQQALAFSVSVRPGTENLQTVSMGHYNRVDEWEYTSQKTGLGLGQSLSSDKGFSLIYEKENVAIGSTSKLGDLKYGIVAVENDMNLKDVPITKDKGTTVHKNECDFWIQSGSTDMSGFFITVGEMNSTVLDMDDLDVTTYDGAQDAIDRAFKATEKISAQRSQIGAQQNRLDFARSIDDNSAENTQAAESRIRDTNIASEMVKYSMENILKQAGESMLAQANQNASNILSLIQ